MGVLLIAYLEVCSFAVTFRPALQRRCALPLVAPALERLRARPGVSRR